MTVYPKDPEVKPGPSIGGYINVLGFIKSYGNEYGIADYIKSVEDQQKPAMIAIKKACAKFIPVLKNENRFYTDWAAYVIGKKQHIRTVSTDKALQSAFQYMDSFDG